VCSMTSVADSQEQILHCQHAIILCRIWHYTSWLFTDFSNCDM